MARLKKKRDERNEEGKAYKMEKDEEGKEEMIKVQYGLLCNKTNDYTENVAQLRWGPNLVNS